MHIKLLPKIFYRFIYIVFIKNLFHPIYVLVAKLWQYFKSLILYIRTLFKCSKDEKKFRQLSAIIERTANMHGLNMKTKSRANRFDTFTLIISDLSSFQSNSDNPNPLSPKRMLLNEYKLMFINEIDGFWPKFYFKYSTLQLAFDRIFLKCSTTRLSFAKEYFDFDDSANKHYFKFKISLDWPMHENIRINSHAPILVIIPDILSGLFRRII